MHFYKFQADQLFTGSKMLSPNHVLICNEQGIVQDIAEEKEAGDNIQKFQGILSPGFVNCHCHLELSHMRGLIPEKSGLVNFVFSIVTQRHFPDEEILEAIKNAEDEMYSNGIIAVGDICNNLLTLQQKLRRNLYYYNFIEASGWLPTVADQRFLKSKEYYENFSKELPSSLVPHAPYSVSEELWDLLKQGFKNKIVSIHNQETVFEDELFLQNKGDFIRMYQLMKLDTSFYKASGKSSLQTYFQKMSSAKQVLLVHNTFTNEEDIEFVKKERPDNSTSFCLCVNANQYIEQSLPAINLLRKHGCHIVLGTDSLASNWSLSIWDEIKTIKKYFASIKIDEMLKWATLNGAEALHIDGTYGSFEKGKQPGVVLIPPIKNGEISEVVQTRRLL